MFHYCPLNRVVWAPNRSVEEEEKVRASVAYNIFRASSARLCTLFKLNGNRKHEWIVRQSLNAAANYSKNRQSAFVNEVKAPFGEHS